MIVFDHGQLGSCSAIPVVLWSNLRLKCQLVDGFKRQLDRIDQVGCCVLRARQLAILFSTVVRVRVGSIRNLWTSLN